MLRMIVTPREILCFPRYKEREVKKGVGKKKGGEKKRVSDLLRGIVSPKSHVRRALVTSVMA